jgi:hypothetical protein
MRRVVAFLCLMTLSCGSALSDTARIQLPADGDEFSKLVARAEAHDETVDFRALRIAWLGSEAKKRAGKKHQELSDLNQEMFAAMQAGKADTLQAKAEAILSIDYTDLMAHKLLRQSCKLLNDGACAELHHFVEFGLLNSIVHSGDGKSCATGLEVVQISEEYFYLNMLDVRLKQQSLVSGGGHTCDAMDVIDENGAEKTYFFRIDLFFGHELD